MPMSKPDIDTDRAISMHPHACHNLFKAPPINSAMIHVNLMTMSNRHACIITNLKQMWCWGWNKFGQLQTDSNLQDEVLFKSNNNTNKIDNSNYNLYPGRKYINVSAGGGHTCWVEKYVD